MKEYFSETVRVIEQSLKMIDVEMYEKLLSDCENTLRKGNSIIVSGLGKNVPVCDKFVGLMHSLGLKSDYMNTNSAVHGEIGTVQKGDLVILLSKSGKTQETVYLYNLLLHRQCEIWLITFEEDGELAQKLDNKLVIALEHEGDMWNVVPTNSTLINLIILQNLGLEMARRMGITLQQFKQNHPGGHIGELLKNV